MVAQAPSSLEYMDDTLPPLADSIGDIRDSERESTCSSSSRQPTDSTSSVDSAGPSTSLKRVKRTECEVTQVEDTGEEMIHQLKEKFHSTTSRSERMRVLTVLPQSWSIRKVANMFGVSRYLVRKAKELVAEKGILSSPNPKGGMTLPAKTEEEVKNFYLSDVISRVMPGKKDFVSVLGPDGKRVHRQKRLLLCNLREAYNEFKVHHDGLKVGFSKFAQLRPRECIIAGGSGTHSVCVCTIHQNVKLMMAGSRLEALTDGEMKHYRHCLAAMQCNPPNVACFLGNCDQCPGTEPIHARLQAVTDENEVDTVEIRQWTTTDRATLQTIVLPVDEFIEIFVAMLKKLMVHDFIAKMQASFLQQRKDTLKDGEFIVVADFSENYSFVVQDEIQSFHWNNAAVTIHPFVCYYVDKGKLTSLCYIVISESLQHDTVAVHLFQKKLVEFLTQECGGKKPQKMVYMSDGCAAQYKNCKNFSNLCHHLEDFGVTAEWHFFATSHGKSAGDGAGGTLKRLVTKASLQRPYENQVLTAGQLYHFAVTEIKGMHFGFATLDEHDQEAKLLEARLRMSRTVPGTLKLHSFIPLSTNTVEVKQFSTSNTSRIEKVDFVEAVNHVSLPFAAISGYVTVIYDGLCWLGYVVGVEESDRVVTVKFLHPCIPAASFVFPARQDILDIDPSDILTHVNPTTATGRTYALSKKEMQDASLALAARLS